MKTVRYNLVWLSGARPPAHPKPMRGSQSFDDVEDAVAFFSQLAQDAKAISLTRVEVITISADMSGFLPADRIAQGGEGGEGC